MSNLGGYQLATEFIKSLGGPERAAKLAFSAGGGIFVAGGLTYAGGQRALRSIRAKLEKRNDRMASEVFVVETDGEDRRGLKLSLGAEYRVLAKDGEAVLIEVLEDTNNPYFTSSEFLTSVSKYPSASQDDGKQSKPADPLSPESPTLKD